MSERSIVINFIAAAATSVVLYAAPLCPSSYVSSEELPAFFNKYNWDSYIQNPYYNLTLANLEVLDRIEVLHNFALRMVEESRDLDPSFAKIINDNFAELI